MYRYRFKITLQPSHMKRANDLMKKLDLGWETIALETEYEISCSKDNDIKTMKEHLVKAFESEDIYILKIEGGKIE